MIKKVIIFVDANNWYSQRHKYLNGFCVFFYLSKAYKLFSFQCPLIYYNLKKWFTPSEIDICKVADLIIKDKDLKILEIRWYASIPSIEDNKLDYMRHMNFLSHLEKRGVKIITRKLQRLSTKEILKKRQELLETWNLCEVCKPIVKESFLDISDYNKKEKGIDVAIAVDMVKEALQNKIDKCILISGDADFVPAFNLIKEIGKEVLSCSVPIGYSNELRQKFPYLILSREMLNKCFREHMGGETK